jgi:hypothetical protein
MKTLLSVILALLMLAAETALAAALALAPVKVLRARSGDSPAAATRRGSRAARDRVTRRAAPAGEASAARIGERCRLGGVLGCVPGRPGRTAGGYVFDDRVRKPSVRPRRIELVVVGGGGRAPCCHVLHVGSFRLLTVSV